MEEKINAMTHGAGALAAVAGMIVLVISACLRGSIWHVVSFSIYGASLIFLYLASTLYHSFSNERIKHIFKIVDHAAIYLLIAGTYTPFTLVLLHGRLGWIMAGVIWGLALVGVIFKVFFVKRFKVISTICYIIMGWSMLIAVKPLVAALPIAGFCWLIVGGSFYTVGTIFYLWRRLPYNHAVWHLFVLAGSAAHFITVFYYVLPVPVSQ